MIVGAGPAGSAAAIALRARGVEAIVLERAVLPRTKVCGSGLSPWALTWLDARGLGAPIRRRAFRIDGARIGGLDGPGTVLRGDHETAVLLRSELDMLLVEAAASRGAEIRDGVRVRAIEADGAAAANAPIKLGPHSCFGERALLKSEARAANVGGEVLFKVF